MQCMAETAYLLPVNYVVAWLGATVLILRQNWADLFQGRAQNPTHWQDRYNRIPYRRFFRYGTIKPASLPRRNARNCR